MADTVSDILTRIRNAQTVRHETVKVPYSNFAWELVKVLEREGFIGEVEKIGRKEKRVIEISLKYENREPALQVIRRISRPGRRIYKKSSQIHPRRGFVTIVSTPKGLMTDREARKAREGGELMCEVGYKVE